MKSRKKANNKRERVKEGKHAKVAKVAKDAKNVGVTDTSEADEPSPLEKVLEEKKSRFIVITLAILIVLLAALAIFNHKNSQEKRAGEMLAAAKTEAEYNEVASNFPKTSAAQSAYILLVDTYLRRAKFEQAQNLLEKFLKTYPKSFLRPNAELLQAQLLLHSSRSDETPSDDELTEAEKNENSEKAEEILRKLIEDGDNNSIKAYAAIILADMRAERDDLAGAETLLMGVAKSPMGTNFGSEIDDKLLLIKAATNELENLPAPTQAALRKAKENSAPKSQVGTEVASPKTAEDVTPKEEKKIEVKRLPKGKKKEGKKNK